MMDEVEEKNEQASPRKLAEAKERGRFALSTQLTLGCFLVAALFALYGCGEFLHQNLLQITRTILTHLNEPMDDLETIVQGFRLGVLLMIRLMAPLFITVCAAALVGTFFQTGFTINFSVIKPQWHRVNPLFGQNYKKLFHGPAFVRLLLGVAKVGIVGVVCYEVVTHALLDFPWRVVDVNKIYLLICRQSFLMGLAIAGALVGIGTLDFAYQKYRWLQGMKMTRQEVKEEHKLAEPAAQVRNKRQQVRDGSVQREWPLDLLQADLLLFNPVQHAVAVKYEAEKMAAPMCVAKGARQQAAAMKEKAVKQGILVVENPFLAHALYQGVEVGSSIPSCYFHEVAAVLAATSRRKV